ncbi:hypothetical protein, partial [Dyella japonica]
RPKADTYNDAKLKRGRKMDSKMSRPISWLALFTMVVVVLFISWQSYQDSQSYTLTPKQVLIDELRALPVPSGAQSLGDLKLTDRSTFYFVDQRYSSSVSRDTVAKSYTDALLAEGWRPVLASSNEYHSLWFCKSGVHASIDFFGDPNSPTYKLSLTTGGWVIQTCG